MAVRIQSHFVAPLPSLIRGAHLRFRWLAILVLFVGGGVRSAQAHVWNMTRVRVTFTDAKQCSVRLEIDLTRALGSAATYYELAHADESVQSRRAQQLFESFWPRFNFRVGAQPLAGKLVHFKFPTGPRNEFGYIGMGKTTEFEVAVDLPPSGGLMGFEPASDLEVEYPLAATYEIPAQNLNITRWLDLPSPSRRFDYHASLALSSATGAQRTAAAESRLDLTEREAKVMTAVLTMWRYFHLGFRHIFPNGADHILFVIGLFFLGISWRKLLTQTTVFTIAHTTTLGLAAAGIFSLPAWFVEPAIAGSIAFVAIENIIRPRLTSGRLVIVFTFGLIHGLGFAGSLAEVGLPKNEFWLALLSFNFGVDFGQLFVLTLCFLVFGWFRDREWFRARVVVPICCTVGLIGVTWAVQRIAHYATTA